MVKTTCCVALGKYHDESLENMCVMCNPFSSFTLNSRASFIHAILSISSSIISHSLHYPSSTIISHNLLYPSPTIISHSLHYPSFTISISIFPFPPLISTRLGISINIMHPFCYTLSAPFNLYPLYYPFATPII